MSLIHLLSRFLIDRERKDWREIVFLSSLVAQSRRNRIFDPLKRERKALRPEFCGRQSQFSSGNFASSTSCIFSKHRNDPNYPRRKFVETSKRFFPFLLLFLPRWIARRQAEKIRCCEVVFTNCRTKERRRDDKYRPIQNSRLVTARGACRNFVPRSGRVGDRVFDIGIAKRSCNGRNLFVRY